MNFPSKVIICVLTFNLCVCFYLLFKCEEARIQKRTVECQKQNLVYVYDKCIRGENNGKN